MPILRHLFLIATLILTGTGPTWADTTNKSIVLDVRTPDEFESAHLKGATNIDVLAPGFEEKVNKLPKDQSYKVHCRSGARSGRAVDIMKKLGFKNVENVGGLNEAANKLQLPCVGAKSC